MQEKNSAGKNIESYCTKCNLSLDHTIVAMTGETIAKVRCKTCGSAHKYKDPSKPQPVKKPRAKRNSAAATAEIIWEASIAEARGKEREYNMAMKYRVGDVVNHSTFGKGIVLKLHANKCEMLFKDRERLMASANEYKRA